jgi:hypothetical protein
VVLPTASGAAGSSGTRTRQVQGVQPADRLVLAVGEDVVGPVGLGVQVAEVDPRVLGAEVVQEQHRAGPAVGAVASTPAGSFRSTGVHVPLPTSGLSFSVRIIRSNQPSSESLSGAAR